MLINQFRLHCQVIISYIANIAFHFGGLPSCRLGGQLPPLPPLPSPLGSVAPVCESCEDTFSELKVRVEKLVNENVELKARIRDLEKLPNMDQSLHFQVESLSKDIEFLQSETSSSNTQVIEKRATPHLRLSNRFEILNYVDQLTAPMEHDEAKGSIPNVATLVQLHPLPQSA